MQQVQSTYIFEELFCKFSNMLYHFWWIALFSFNSFNFKGHQLFLKEERIKTLIIQLKKKVSYVSYEMLIWNWNQGKKVKHWKMSCSSGTWNIFNFIYSICYQTEESYIPKPVLSYFYISIQISHRYNYHNTELVSILLYIQLKANTVKTIALLFKIFFFLFQFTLLDMYLM